MTRVPDAVQRVFETIRRKPDVKFWTGAQILDWYLAESQRRRGAAPSAVRLIH